jgi:hypothetical protein
MSTGSKRGRNKAELSAKPKAKSDAYVGILALSLVLQIAGAVFLYLDWDQHPKKEIPPVAAKPALPGAPGPAGPGPKGPPAPPDKGAPPGPPAPPPKGP